MAYLSYEEVVSALLNQFIGSSKLLIESQGYSVQVVSHQEPFLSKQSRYAIIIEREQTIDTLEGERKLVQFTKREKEICYYLKKRYTYKEIVEVLFISIHTLILPSLKEWGSKILIRFLTVP